MFAVTRIEVLAHTLTYDADKTFGTVEPHYLLESPGEMTQQVAHEGVAIDIEGVGIKWLSSQGRERQAGPTRE